MTKPCLLGSVFLILSLGFPSKTYSQVSTPGLLAYEPFSATGVPLQASASGSGWNSGWIVQNNDQSVPGYSLAAVAPLQFPGLAQSGGYAVGGSSYQTAGRALNTSSSGPFANYLTNGAIGTAGTTIWASALLRKDTSSNDELSLTLVPGGTPWWASNGHLAMGFFGGSSTVGGVRYWSLKTDGQVIPTTVAIVTGQAALLVLRIDFGASNSAASLFVNPAIGANPPANSSAQSTAVDSLAFSNVAFYGGDVAGKGSVDEIRIGTGFAAVAPPLAGAAEPQNLAAVAGDGQVTLSWNASTGASSYNLYQAAAGAFSPIATGLASTTFSLPGLSDGSPYSFYVTAVGSTGESSPSNIVTATPQSGLGNAPVGLLAHEPFAANAGPLLGAADGAGWASPWSVQNGSTVVPGLNIAAASPLCYPGLPQSGNYATGGYQYLSAGRGFDLSSEGAFRNVLSGGLIGKPGTTLWMSVLLREDTASQDGFYVALHSGSPAWNIGNGVLAGYFGGASYDSSKATGYWSLQVDGTVYRSTAPVVVGQPALLVVRMDFGTATKVSFYVNPPVAGAPPATPDVQISSSNSQAFTNFGFASGNNSNEASFDEIRIAADFATLLNATADSPTPPSTVTASSGNGQVTLNWTPVGEASSYQVWGSTDGTNFNLLATVTGTTYTQTGLANNATYTYYVTTVTGAGVSLDSTLAATVPRAPVPPPHAVLGTNLAAISDFTREWPFVDIFKLARTWISQQQGQPWGQGPPLQLTPEGWPASLQSGQFAETIIFDNQLEDNAADYPTGNYTLLYDGQGTIEFDLGSASIVSQTPGRMVVNVPGLATGIFVKITQTNSVDPLRNIRFIMPGFESVYQSQPFHPLFLQRLQNYRALRFMEWMSTNNSTVQNWSDRALPTDYTKTQKGVDLETMIQLANTLHVSPWFNIPNAATDDYVQQFAQLVYAQLDPALPAYIEYSNETWNGQFAQNAYVQNQGLTLGLSQDPTQAGAYYTSLRSVQIFQIFQKVFGGSQRLVRVLPSQAANASMSKDIVSFRNAAAFADVLAIAPYYSMCSDQAIGGSGFLGDPSTQAQVAAMTPDQVLDIELFHIQHCAQDQITSNRAVALQYGLNLVAYEGGQSLMGTGTAQNNAALDSLFKSVNRNARMQSLYQTFLQNWVNDGGDMFMHYTDIGSYTKYGSFGTYEFQDEDLTTSPKYQALAAFAAQNH